jgi:hypothetical protein
LTGFEVAAPFIPFGSFVALDAAPNVGVSLGMLVYTIGCLDGLDDSVWVAGFCTLLSDGLELCTFSFLLGSLVGEDVVDACWVIKDVGFFVGGELDGSVGVSVSMGPSVSEGD